MQINNNIMLVNGKAVQLDTPPVILNNITMIPVRAIADSLGAETQWSDMNKIVSITTNDIPIYADCPNVPDLGRIFNIDLKTKIVYDDAIGYVYNSDDIYNLSGELDLLNEYYSQLGYFYATESDGLDTYYKTGTMIYINNNRFIIRLVFRVLDDNDEEVFIVEVNNAVKSYNINGDEQYIPHADKEAWQKLGWYTDINDVQQTLYAPDGRTANIFKSTVQDWLSVGWYENIDDVRQTLYSLDGRTIVVYKSKVPDYLNVGWYENIESTKQTLYASDGRTIIVFKSEVPQYLKVGWYESSYTAPTTSQNAQYQSSTNIPVYINDGSGTVYIGETGNKYHKKIAVH